MQEESAERTPSRVTFLAQGGFNRLYKVETSSHTYVTRVPLPLNPHYKTESEAVTLDYVRTHTSIPVPKVTAFNSTPGNAKLIPGAVATAPTRTCTASGSAKTTIGQETGLEWLLIDFMPGQILETAWETMSWRQKKGLVKEVAASVAQLTRQRFDRIGSLYHNSRSSTKADAVVLGKVVSKEFFWSPSHMQQDVSKELFLNSREWPEARLQLAINECSSKLLNDANFDEDDKEDLDDTLALANQLRDSISALFPDEHDTAAYCLHHPDLSWHNLLANEDGVLTATLDWDCVHTAPLWKAFEMPAFLQGKIRLQEPNEDEYYRPSPEAAKSGEESDVFKDHMLEYEQTSLRNVFKKEMDRLLPEWSSIYEQSRKKIDFEFAMDACDDGIWCSRAHQWLRDALQGDRRRVRGEDYCP